MRALPGRSWFSFLPTFLPWFLRPSRLGPVRSLLLGLSVGFSASLSLTGLALYALDAWKRGLRKKGEVRVIEVRENEVLSGVEGLIGQSDRPACRHQALSGLAEEDS